MATLLGPCPATGQPLSPLCSALRSSETLSNLLQGTQLKPTLVVSTALLPLRPAPPLFLGQFPAADPEAASSSCCLLGTMFRLPSLGVDTAETTGAAGQCEFPGQIVCACKAPQDIRSRLPEKRPRGPLGRPLNCIVSLEIVSSPHWLLALFAFFFLFASGKAGPCHPEQEVSTGGWLSWVSPWCLKAGPSLVRGPTEKRQEGWALPPPGLLLCLLLPHPALAFIPLL